MEKTQLPKKMKKKLTKNEKTLLILLGIVIVFWATFRFIIIPQSNKLKILTKEKCEYEEKISHMNTILKSEKKIEDERRKLEREKYIILNKYFSKLDQPQIIYLLNEIFDSEELDILDINFNRPSEEQIGDLMVKTMDITVPYRGSYEGLIETIRGIGSSPKKILISSLIIDKDLENQLAGDMSLKIYSLEGISEIQDDLAYIDIVSENDKSNPFKAYEDYKETDNENEVLEDDNLDNGYISVENETSNISVESETPNIDDNKKEILEDFEGGDLYFIPSNKNIKGSILKSLNSKSKEHSIRFEYNILGLEDENRAYIDLTDRNIVLKYPPSSIGLWVHAYNYSPASLGIRLKGQAGEKVDVELTKGIRWIGWEYIEAQLPQDLSLYPLQLDRIYIELNDNRDDYGVLLFDKLEAIYPRNSTKTSEKFTLYIVEKEDTLDKISKKIYGTVNKKNLIMKYNEINSNKDIWEGKILVIPR